jgi:hypothetical protein
LQLERGKKKEENSKPERTGRMRLKRERKKKKKYFP